MGFIPTSPFSLSAATLLFIIFFIFSSTHARFNLPQGGSSLKHTAKNTQMERSLLIGSRPPRCEKKYCRNCGHCEAVQVPIVPKFIRSTTQQAHVTTTPKHIYASRGDDLSNYKPMCWKCKCGDFMFNP